MILKIIPALLTVLLIACSSPQQKITETAPPEYSIEQFMNTVQIFGASFSPDESKILFTSKASGIFNSYTVPVSGGEATQLTESPEDYAIALDYFPKDERFLYTGDRAGNEINHIYLRNPDGTVQDMTPDSTAKAQFYGWAHDDKSFFITSNKRDPRYFDLYEVTINDTQPSTEGNLFVTELKYENNGYTIGAISPNKQYLALIESITTNDNNMYLHDHETGETTLISPHEEFASFSPQYFSIDNQTLVFTSNDGQEFESLRSYDLGTGEITEVQSEDWDIVFAGISKNGKYRYLGINADAKTEIRIYDGENNAVLLPALPDGEITSISISPSEKLMAFYVNSSTAPSNLYCYDFSTGDYTKLTETMNPEIDREHLVSGDVIRFASFDGLEIPALLYKPQGIQEGELRPAILDIHGGPGGQRRLNYQSSIQYLVNHGYVVLSVNNRGSSGYGKSFYAADDLKHGDVDLKDCIWSKKFLESTGYVDPDKIGIMGGSYGGYMVMAALTFAPEEFNVGVNYYGVTNWLRTLNSIPPWWESFREALYKEIGHPVEDSIALYNKSPLFHAQNITKPLIVLQGTNDPRVIKPESDDIVAAAQANGVPVEYVVFEDEGHGFLKKENQIEASQRVLDFLDRYLWKKEDPQDSVKSQ